MKIGMLWFDNDPKTGLDVKVNRAAEYYQRKYGRKPQVCLVHPSMFKGSSPRVSGIEIRISSQVQRNHLWMGITEVV
jgi:hypothetical protein